MRNLDKIGSLQGGMAVDKMRYLEYLNLQR